MGLARHDADVGARAAELAAAMLVLRPPRHAHGARRRGRADVGLRVVRADVVPQPGRCASVAPEAVVTDDRARIEREVRAAFSPQVPGTKKRVELAELVELVLRERVDALNAGLTIRFTKTHCAGPSGECDCRDCVVHRRAVAEIVAFLRERAANCLPHYREMVALHEAAEMIERGMHHEPKAGG